MPAADLAAFAGDTLVVAASTEAWEALRDGVSRLFGRGQPDPRIDLQLDETRRLLAEASTEDRLRVRQELAGQWRARFAGLLADYPPAEAELTDLLRDLQEIVWPGFYQTEQSAAAGALGSAGAGAPARGWEWEAPDRTEAPAPSAPPASLGLPRPDAPPMAGSTAPPEPVEQGETSSLHDDPVVNAIRGAVKPGVLAFNPPPEMTQGRKERVEVGIARSPELREALLAGLRGQGEVQFEEVPTSMLMGVELRGSSFEIDAFSPLEQVVAPTARWEFDVRPLRSGVQTLTLCVSMRVEAPAGAAGRIGVPVLERQIRIRVSVGYGTRTFLVSNWRWLIATAVAVAAAAGAWAAVVH